jgi:hypothetical protein
MKNNKFNNFKRNKNNTKNVFDFVHGFSSNNAVNISHPLLLQGGGTFKIKNSNRFFNVHSFSFYDVVNISHPLLVQGGGTFKFKNYIKIKSFLFDFIPFNKRNYYVDKDRRENEKEDINNGNIKNCPIIAQVSSRWQIYHHPESKIQNVVFINTNKIHNTSNCFWCFAIKVKRKHDHLLPFLDRGYGHFVVSATKWYLINVIQKNITRASFFSFKKISKKANFLNTFLDIFFIKHKSIQKMNTKALSFNPFIRPHLTSLERFWFHYATPQAWKLQKQCIPEMSPREVFIF